MVFEGFCPFRKLQGLSVLPKFTGRSCQRAYNQEARISYIGASCGAIHLQRSGCGQAIKNNFDSYSHSFVQVVIRELH